MQKWIHKGIRTVLAAGLASGLLALAGCSKSPEARLLDAGRCMKAGWLLEDRELMAAAEYRQKRVVADMPSINGSMALYAARMNEQINDEIGMHRSRQGAMETLLEWQASSMCQSMVKEARQAGQ
jgi:hypothetical protein